jgi:hypothetical protein
MFVKDAASTASKWSTRAAASDKDYQAGVQGAGQRWVEGAAASEQAYVSGVQAAASKGSFGKGVRKAGGAKYQDRAVKYGVDRFRTGVQGNANAYQTGVQPYLAALSSTTLDPRGARGSSQNARRVQQVMDLMRATRDTQLG